MNPLEAFSDPTTAAARPPRAAATLVVARDGPGGFEVLLSRRAERGDRNSGAWVFPGGIVDPGDRDAHACCAGLDDRDASTRLGLSEGGLDYAIAAIRECFEESGLLFANGPDGGLVALDDEAGIALGSWRGLLHRQERTLVEFCAATGLRLAVDRLAYLSHWLTPLGRAKRFDTRFFVAALPRGQTAAFDGTEMVEQLWLRPADALDRQAELRLMTPTQKTLEQIRDFASTEALLAWVRTPRSVPRTLPRIGNGALGARPVLPDEPAYAELGRIDPAGHGTGSYDIRPDVPVRLSPRVIRVTADNGSMMTGPGTNTYLVGGAAGKAGSIGSGQSEAGPDEAGGGSSPSGSSPSGSGASGPGPGNAGVGGYGPSGAAAGGWAVIDPGPPSDAHLEAILAAAPGPIRWIFVTHTHKDHSPLARALQARTGATLYGRVADHPEWQDTDFVPDVTVADGERFELPGPDGGASTLRAIRTPGHASNHVCYLLEEEKLLFTGDHVMQASTVVINPPDGDMAAYVGSLRGLLDEDLDWLAPGHGFLMAEPVRAMQWIIDHRQKRENKVVAGLTELGAVDEATLLARVYDDVPPRLHPPALRSLRAHLLKLRDERRAVEADGRWQLVS